MDLTLDLGTIGKSPQDLSLQKCMKDAAALYRHSGQAFMDGDIDWIAVNTPDFEIIDILTAIERQWDRLRERYKSVPGAEKLINSWHRRYEVTEWY